MQDPTANYFTFFVNWLHGLSAGRLVSNYHLASAYKFTEIYKTKEI